MPNAGGNTSSSKKPYRDLKGTRSQNALDTKAVAGAEWWANTGRNDEGAESDLPDGGESLTGPVKMLGPKENGETWEMQAIPAAPVPNRGKVENGDDTPGGGW